MNELTLFVSSSCSTFYWYGGILKGAGNLIIQGKMVILTSAIHSMDGSVILVNQGYSSWLDGVRHTTQPPSLLCFLLSLPLSPFELLYRLSWPRGATP
jgi:hypothetical protein